MIRSYNCAQTFYINKGSVKNAKTVGISAIDLFFQSKPDRVNNDSGLSNPQVTIAIVPTIYGVPNLLIGEELIKFSTVSYDEVAVSSDASIPTRFRFSPTLPVETEKEYAIIILFAGSENFKLWKNKIGEYLINTRQISAGVNNKYIGKYFDFTNTTLNYNAEEIIQNQVLTQEYVQSQWKPLADTDLKFAVMVARYAIDGVPVSNVSSNTLPVYVPINQTGFNQTANSTAVTITYPMRDIEVIVFNQAKSTKERFVGGQFVFQNTFSYPGGWANGAGKVTVSCSSNTRVVASANYSNGAAFNWEDIFQDYEGVKYIVLRSGDIKNVRQVKTFANNVLEVIEPVSFTNATAEFLITPVGMIDSFNKTAAFGAFDSIMILGSSSANSKVRFVNNTIESVSISNGGVGYSNSDVIYFKGFEYANNIVEGGYIACANVVTDANGKILQVYLSNSGAGFTNTGNISALVVTTANSAILANNSAGGNAVFTYDVGATLLTEYRPNIFKDCRVSNFELSDILPIVNIDRPNDTSYSIKLRTQYFAQANALASSGLAYYVNDDPTETEFNITQGSINRFFGDNSPVFMSKSNEFYTFYENGAENDLVGVNKFSNNLVLTIAAQTNNDFESVFIKSVPGAQISKSIINNDWTNEYVDTGNALARHLTSIVNFDRLAEDTVVYVTAYKPPKTDIKVFARVYNNLDSDAFDDKEWTLLKNTDDANLISSATNPYDYKEYTFKVDNSPAVGNVLTSQGSTQLNNNQVVGIGSTFVDDIANGQMVRISNRLFPNHYLIDTVNTVSNNTLLILDNNISNATFVATGSLIVEKISRPKQAFLNTQNGNILRYYNDSGQLFDRYNSIQVKVVMLSEKPNIIPRIDDVRFVGVSA